MKLYTLIILLIFSSFAYSQTLEVAETILFEEEIPLVMAGTTAAGVDSNIMYTKGSSPIDVYIAVHTSGIENETQYVNIADAGEIIDMSNLSLNTIRLIAEYTTPNSNYEFLVAVQDQDDNNAWKVLENSPESLAYETATKSYTYNINLNTLNNVANADMTDTEDK